MLSIRTTVHTKEKRKSKYYPTRKKITAVQQGKSVAKEKHQPL